MKDSLMLKKILLLLAFLPFVAPMAFSQAVGTINTVAGGVPNNVPALSVGIGYPTAVTKDSFGNIYVAVQASSDIIGGVFKINPNGILTTVAGNGSFVYYTTGTLNNGDGGPATSATLGYVTGMFVDSQQNIYISDSTFSTIRKVTASTGIINTIAGGGAGCGNASSIGDGCAATSAILNVPYQLFVDGNQNLFIADTGNNRIREVAASTGLMQTVAGGGTGCANQSDSLGDGCPATSATLANAEGVYLDANGNIFISDSGNARVREVSVSTSTIQTIAGTGTAGYNGDGILATTAEISDPTALFVDGSENVFFSDLGNGRVRVIAASNSFIQTIVGGSGSCSTESDSVGDGCPASEATVYPFGVFVDSSNNLYIADYVSSLVREVVASDGVLNSGDIIQAVVGNGTAYFSGDGQLATQAELNIPYDVAADASGNFYIADYGNSRIRKVSAGTGIIETVAGGGKGCTGQTDSFGDGCLATQATLLAPTAVFVDGAGNLYISDYADALIRKVSATTGIISTVAGGGTGCTAQTDTIGDGCPATQVAISSPFGLYVDANGNIFLGDIDNYRVREVVASTGLIQTVAGTGTPGYNGDNISAVTAEIDYPTGIYGDSTGNIYFSDLGNSRIREIVASTQFIQTVVGTGTPGYNGDGITAITAEILDPYALFIDNAGNIFFSDYGNFRIREVVSATGLIQTVAGNGTFGFSGDGGPATSAEVSYIPGIGGDTNGNIFLADSYDLRVREIFGVVPADTLAVTTPSLPAATVGTSYSFALQAIDGNPPYTWSILPGSSTPPVSISSTGVLSGTPGTAGTYQFVVQVADSASHVATKSFSLSVNSPATLQSIAVTAPSYSIVQGSNVQFTATGTYSDGSTQNLTSTAIWSSANSSIATINGSGLASGVGPGITTITATSGNINGSAALTVTTLTGATLVSIAVIPLNPTLAINTTQTFDAIGTFSDGTTQNLSSSVTWSSGTTNVANVNASGIVTTGTSSGSATISATQGSVAGSSLVTVNAVAPYAYIGTATSANCCLDVVNISNNSIVASIPVTGLGEPFGITPDQSKLYVADYNNSLVDVVNTATNTLETTIPVGLNANAVAITPNGQFGYTANSGDNTVSVFNVATNTLVTNIQTGISAGAVNITPDGKSVYVSGTGNTLAVINTATNTVSSTFQVTVPSGDQTACCLFGPIINPAGTVGYIVQNFQATTPGTVTVLSIPSNTVLTSITVGAWPTDIVMSPDGTRVYVANLNSNSVSVIDTSTSTVIATVPVATGPQSVAVSPDGTLVYVASPPSNTVSIIQSSTNTITSTFTLTTPFGILIPAQPSPSQATALTLAPPNLIFSSQVTGTPSFSQTINVTNPSASPVSFTSIALTGPNASDFSLSNNTCPAGGNNLAGGGTCSLQVVFEPTATGSFAALVTFITTNGTAVSTQSVPLSGVGVTLQSAFSGLTLSQSIQSGTASITLGGAVANGTTYPATGEAVLITINGTTVSATIGSNGAFSTAFPTSGIPASTSPYTITYAYSGDNSLSGVANTSTTLTVNAAVLSYTLTVTPIGTGSGTVTDNQQQINCVLTVGVQSGTCSASFTAGTPVTLSAVASGTTTFAGWGGACSGTTSCLVTMNSPLSVTASFTPPPQPINLSFTPGTSQTGMATYDCPSNPNPSPTNPCTDPNAHALALAIPQVLVPFTVTVLSSEVPPMTGNGICPNGDTPTQDFDCRFVTYFTYSTDASGDEIVPLCYPYANGNCVHYQVYSGTPGTEPNPSDYVGPIDWEVSWNNDTFVPPAPYTGSIPQLYDDPDYAVSSTATYGTNCSTPMLLNGNPTNPPIYCQFEFDITTGYNPNKKVDAGITGRTKQFNDVVVAFPPANVGNLTITDAPLSATVTAGSPIGFTITVTNSAGGAVTGAVLNDALPAGTSVNWTISPTYSGPGTCAITGSAGSQALSCSFGTVAASQAFAIGLLSTGSSIGTYTDTATTQIGNQQILSIGTLTVQGVTTGFSGLTPSQTIQAGTASINLGGIIGNGTQFPPSTETVSISIGSLTQTAAIGSNGTFSTTFQTSSLPASSSPYTITYSYAGDGTFSSASDTSTTLTVTAPAVFYTLAVTPIGTGSGTVTDNLQEIDCILTAGLQSGTCSASYPSGTTVILTATPSGNSAFAGWGSACTGTTTCSVTMNSAETVTASFPPPPQLINLTFAPGTTVTGMATYDCPSNPNPTPTNPCTDPNAHALQLSIPQVLQSITLTVQATEVPPSMGNGICPNGDTPTQDFDCRFVSFFTYGTDASGDEIVPLCYPYANGNCVHYQVYSGTPGTEPNPSNYVGPIDWEVSWNNDAFVPPAPYTGSTPQLYDDPDYAVNSTSPYGTNCSTPMLINGNQTDPPIYCQFVFDITTGYFPNKKVDAGITGRTKQFNDVVVAFPPANVGNLTITDVPLSATVTAGSPIGFTITVTNSAGGAVANAVLTDALPAGTNVNWAISPAYSGPGTCAINGTVGSQVLSCTFGTITASQTFTMGLLSSSSSIGTYTDTTTTQIGNQQILSIGTLTVTGITAAFSSLTPSQTIPAGTASINLSGVIGTGTQFPPSGEKVSIVIGSVTQQATIGANGTFSTLFPTTSLAASSTAYTITYSYAGDGTFSPATNTSTTLTVTSLATQTITLTGVPTSAVYGATFTVSASASSGLPVTIGVSGLCSLKGSTVTMTSGTGTCTVTASQAGNSSYAPAQKSQNVTAQKAKSATTITSTSPNPSTVSQVVSVAFTVSGVTAPTGTVIITASTGETCSGTLAAGKGSCAITFTTSGSRTLTGAYSGDTNFNASLSNSITQVVNPAATSTLVASPASMNFGQIPLGGLTLSEVKLTNTGKTTITLSKIAMSTTGTGDYDDFFVISLCPGTLKAGASCILGVGYVPNRDDSIGIVSSANVLVTSNAAGSPLSIPLQATTINPKASLSSTLLAFGSQKVGTASASKTVTLKSTGTSPLILDAISVTGNFALASGTTCSAGQSLSPSQTCNIVVTFKPTKTGFAAGAVNISDNTLLCHTIVLLTGTGTR
jgi:YVTN family beta-propeller protein